MISAQYRQDYTGEFVISQTRLANGTTQQTREWIPNMIENDHISGRAAVIGSAVDRGLFDFARLERHRGGLLGKKKLQTYGSGEVWRDMCFDFFATNERKIAREMHRANYYENTVVYTTAGICVDFPGDYYLTPHSPAMCSAAVAVYLAAFDQHQEVFLLGYNNDTPAVDRGWVEQTNTVFATYPGVRFCLVGAASNMPTVWRENRNVDTMKYREFVTYCDV